MEQEKVVATVVNVIEQAKARSGKSFNAISKQVGLHPSTLERWRAGETESFHLGALVELFKLSGLSMDEAFGLDPAAAQSLAERIDLAKRFDRLDERLAILDPVLRLANSFAAQVLAGQAAPGAVEPATPAARKLERDTRAARESMRSTLEEARQVLRDAPQPRGQKRQQRKP